MERSVRNQFADAFAHSGSKKIRDQVAQGELWIEDEEFFSGGHLTRYRVHKPDMHGVQEIVQLAPGFSVITTSFESFHPQTTSYSGSGWLVLQCCIAGEYDISINDAKPQRLRPGDCRLDILLDEATWTRRQIVSSCYRYIGIFVRPDDLFLLLSAGERSRKTLQGLLTRGDVSGIRDYTFMASKNLIASVNEIAEFGSFGGLRSAFVKAKAIELLVYALNKVRWSDLQCESLQHRAALSRGTKIAHSARDIIDREFAVPHTMDELANRVGSNRTTLAQAFKVEYHQTPMQYLKSTRLNHAREMLLHHEGSVQAVAEHVGYSDAASFVRAYRRYYGVTPGKIGD